MKSTRFLFRAPLRKRRVLPLAAAYLSLAAGSAIAAEITLNAGPVATGDDIGTSSFAAATNWSNALAPAAGNTYVVPAGHSLRTPADSATDWTFAGDSLTIHGNLVYKGITNTNTITINHLTLEGATVNSASNSSTPFILAGDGIAIAGTGTSRFFGNNATITINAPISGTTGKLLLESNGTTTGRQLILAADNTYTGTIETTGASGAELAATGKLHFKIGASGVSNTIIGTAPFAFNGTFVLDLTGAGDAIGDSWTLVNAATLAETFGESFSVEGFSQYQNVWTSADGRYQFRESTGVLSRISGDSDGDGLPDAWEQQYFAEYYNAEYLVMVDPDGDFDGDNASNLSEYQGNTDPTDANSWPDTDNDGINDGWELYYFGNLGYGADADPDGDYNSNLVEFLAGTLPNVVGSYPDTDDEVGDTLNDGWEIHYFGSIEAEGPDGDPDGDLFSNGAEFLAGTDPTSQISSSDTDEDGLPDGWEVKYFRVGSEDLAGAIARQSGTGDPEAAQIFFCKSV